MNIHGNDDKIHIKTIADIIYFMQTNNKIQKIIFLNAESIVHLHWQLRSAHKQSESFA